MSRTYLWSTCCHSSGSTIKDDDQSVAAGAAVAGINDPVLPGAKVTSKDLPDGPKPLDAVKGSGGADIGGALSKASDKAGKSTPDVKVPGFGPFKFNPKEDAKQAAKKSPIGFLRAPALTLQVNTPCGIQGAQSQRESSRCARICLLYVHCAYCITGMILSFSD